MHLCLQEAVRMSLNMNGERSTQFTSFLKCILVAALELMEYRVWKLVSMSLKIYLVNQKPLKKGQLKQELSIIQRGDQITNIVLRFYSITIPPFHLTIN